MLKVIKIFKTIMFCVTALALGALVYSFYSVPDEICTVPNEKISINEIYSLEYVTTEMTEKEIQSFSDEGDYKVNVKLFNAMPIKTMNMKISKRRYVVPSGEIFGLRLFTDGVIIVGTNDIETENGTKNSAAEAGIKIGDAIISINGKSVRTCSEVSEIFASYNGTPFDLCYERDGKQYNTKFTLYYSQTDNKYIAGLWIRDSAAGIGTLTYYYKSNAAFAGLGHGVYDSDTNEVLPLYNGDIVHACINGCYKGKSGQAGELCGVFTSDSCGSMKVNCDTGVYGFLDEINENAKEIPVALSDEVKTGPAQIISTVDSNGPQTYSIEIEKIETDSNTNRNMIIKITDEKLIEKTGGIVQGMSGSPIIQNGMLVGAVTHVLINDPLHGYAIFAENMIETSDAVVENSMQLAS